MLIAFHYGPSADALAQAADEHGMMTLCSANVRWLLLSAVLVGALAHAQPGTQLNFSQLPGGSPGTVPCITSQGVQSVCQLQGALVANINGVPTLIVQTGQAAAPKSLSDQVPTRNADGSYTIVLPASSPAAKINAGDVRVYRNGVLQTSTVAAGETGQPDYALDAADARHIIPTAANPWPPGDRIRAAFSFQ